MKTLTKKKEIHRYSDYPFKKVSDVFRMTRNVVENLTGKYDDTFIINHQGGSSSGKTYSNLQSIIWDLYCLPNSKCTVVGETVPALRKGAITDFHNIWKSEPFFRDFIVDYNRTNLFATMSNGSKIEFVSYENKEGAKHGKREFLFLNEITGIKKEIVDELIRRCQVRCYSDYNSNKRFWVHDELIPREDCVTIYSNFTHNRFCPEKTKKELLRLKLKKNPNDWLVYGLGKTGKPSNTKSFFGEFDIDEHVVDDIKIDWNIPLLLTMDFNYNPTSCILMQLDRAKGLKIIKEYQQEGGTRKMIQNHLMWLKGKPLLVTGDNSGWARQSSAEHSDWQIVQRLLATPISGVTRKANMKHHLSRILCNNVFFNVPVFISKKGCPQLIQELEFAEETEKGTLRKDDGDFRMDLVDAFRYGIHYYFKDYHNIEVFGQTIKETEEINKQYHEEHREEVEKKAAQYKVRLKR